MGKKMKSKEKNKATEVDESVGEKKKSKHVKVNELDKGISSVGSGELSMNIQGNGKTKEVPNVSLENEVGKAASSSNKDGNEARLRSSDSKMKKKKKNSEVPIDVASSQCLMSTDDKSESKKRKKKNNKKKIMGEDRENEEFNQKKIFKENGSNSGEVTPVNDDKTKKNIGERADNEFGEEIKRKRSKQTNAENAKSAASGSSSDGVVSAIKASKNDRNDQQTQNNSSVTNDHKSAGRKRKTKDGANEVPEKQKKMKPMKHSVEEGLSKTGRDKTSSKLSSKKKKVSFSGHDEVFPSTAKRKQSGKGEEEGLVRGKRYSEEEDELIREAVFEYIRVHNLGEDGLKKVLNALAHPEARGCWKEIGASLPWRPIESIYNRAQNLFRRSEKRKWETEELDLIRRYYKEHGAKWKEMAEMLGKHRVHVKDAWRRHIRLTSQKKGRWSQVEYQSLFDLVNADLILKAFEERKSKHGMLRENIAWSAISEKISTRLEMHCCMKWYDQLASPMVSQGIWADTDDYLLIDELLKLDACCVEDVDWDSLLDNRSGEVCSKRWREMTRHIGGARERSFIEQVEILASRYCSHIIDYRTGTDVKSDV